MTPAALRALADRIEREHPDDVDGQGVMGYPVAMIHAKIIREMQQSDQVVHVIRERQADDLVKVGLVRRVTIQPAPVKGQAAVNLTALGKAYKGTHVTEPEPVVGQYDD